MRENELNNIDFEETAGRYLAGESEAEGRLLELMETDVERRREFFQAMDANIALGEFARVNTVTSEPDAPAPKRRKLKSRFGLVVAATAASVLVALVTGARLFFADRPAIRLSASLNDCRLWSAAEPDIQVSEIRGVAFARSRGLSVCELDLGKDANVRVRHGGHVRLERKSGAWHLKLRAGELLVHLRPGTSRLPVWIDAGRAKVIVKGTRVSVKRERDGVLVRLLKGKVDVRNAGMGPRAMKAGESIMLRAGNDRVANTEARLMSPGERNALARDFVSMEFVRKHNGNAALVRRELFRAATRGDPSMWRARLVLNNGRELRGYVRKTATHYIVLNGNGGKTSVRAEQVVEMEILFGRELEQ